MLLNQHISIQLDTGFAQVSLDIWIYNSHNFIWTGIYCVDRQTLFPLYRDRPLDTAGVTLVSGVLSAADKAQESYFNANPKINPNDPTCATKVPNQIHRGFIAN